MFIWFIFIYLWGVCFSFNKKSIARDSFFIRFFLIKQNAQRPLMWNKSVIIEDFEYDLFQHHLPYHLTPFALSYHFLFVFNPDAAKMPHFN